MTVISAERRAAVDRAREEWVRRLIDLSRRNNLLYFRDLKSGTFDVTQHNPVAMARLIGHSEADRPAVDAQDLLASAASPEESRHRLTALESIRRRALENIEERGLETMFIAAGLASWPAEDGGRPTQSPVLLFPMALEKRGREGQSLAFRATGEAVINPVLGHALRQFFGIELDAVALLAQPESVDEEGDSPERPDTGSTALRERDPDPAATFVDRVFSRLKAAVETRAGAFSIDPRSVLGNFAFQKIVMVNDIQALGDELAGHDLIAAIAGVTNARRTVGIDQQLGVAEALDLVSPSAEFLVVDADSSQQRVISAVLAGKDGVIQGPPGTGKSQTIVNLIASLAAEGKSALFVAEKRAALEVVLRRLENNGLGDLALDLHGADISRRKVMAHIAKTLTAVRDALPVPDEALHATFDARRKRLNGHVEKMHAQREPSGLSVFDLQARLLRTPAGANANTRWRGAELDAMTAGNATRIRELLQEAGGFRDLFLRRDESPWTWSRLSDGQQARDAMERAAMLAGTTLPHVRAVIAAFAAEAGLTEPPDMASALAILNSAVAMNDTLRVFRPEVGAALEARAKGALPSAGGPPSALIEALSPAAGGPLARLGARLFNGKYRASVKTALLLRLSPAPIGQVRRELIEAETRLHEWAAVTGGAPPRVIVTADGALAAVTSLANDLGLLDEVFVDQPLSSRSLSELETTLGALASDAATPARIPLRTSLEAALEAMGATPFAAELRSGLVSLPTELWALAFDHAYFASCLDDVRLHDPELAGFVGETHSRIEAEFVALDRARLELSRARVRRAWAQRAVEVMNAFPEQTSLVRAEAAKKTRHLPLRRLFARAPDVLTALTPCLMASPLSVSQLLDGSKTYFDTTDSISCPVTALMTACKRT